MMLKVNAEVGLTVDDIFEAEIDSKDFRELVAGLIGYADECLEITLDIESTLEEDIAAFTGEASLIVMHLKPNQKIIARAFLTALLAELGDA
ncbi:MAG: hypothetical protein RL145_2302 [Pseudomonadota bacterium]|jgi:hypothetical protein